MTVSDPALGLVAPFDIKNAHQLYRWLIAPFEPYLNNTQHLIVVADGSLHSLPFSLLLGRSIWNGCLSIDSPG